VVPIQPVRRPDHRQPTCGQPDRLRPASGVEDSDLLHRIPRATRTGPCESGPRRENAG